MFLQSFIFFNKQNTSRTILFIISQISKLKLIKNNFSDNVYYHFT